MMSPNKSNTQGHLTMDKITLMATIVDKVARNNNLEHSKNLVIQDFRKHFPNENIKKYNTELPEHITEHFLKLLPRLGSVTTQMLVLEIDKMFPYQKT